MMMKLFFSLLLNCAALSAYCQNQKTSVYFGYDQYKLTTATVKILDSLIASNPNDISLSGYCDTDGNFVYNDTLSMYRVNAVKQYLLSKTVPPGSFVNEAGFGKRKPLENNGQRYYQSFNRRVDIEYKAKQNMTENAMETSASKKTDIETQLKDTSAKPGSNITLPYLNFIGGRHDLLPTALPYLAELLQALEKNPTLAIEIQGHICCEYTEPDGLDNETNTYTLSVNRAKAIYDYLISKGIAAERLSYKGFGSKRPKVYPERNENDRITNRRVEIKILAK